MRMSIQNEMPGYNDVDQLLNQQGVGLTPAEMHGLISGLLCGGNTDSSWQPLVHDLTNEGLAFGHELAQALRNMHSAISDSLDDDGFILHFIQLRLANAKTKQEVVDPTGEGVGTVKDAHRIAFRQIQLKEETVVIQ